jgi:hypothetical protein
MRTQPNFLSKQQPTRFATQHPLVEMTLEQATQNLSVAPTSRDIQSIAGPGNLTYCLVLHALQVQQRNEAHDFRILSDPEELAVSQWPLNYRSDSRNWRRWKDSGA